MDRDQAIDNIRLNIELPSDNSEKADRIRFQNEVLRPILKFQNDILIQHFIAYAASKKKDIIQMSKPKQIEFINLSLSHDQKLKQFFLGMIIGLFSSAEYHTYLQDQKEINKRITTMLSERIRDQLTSITD